MTDNEKLKLAEQFIEDVQVALQSEADYYSVGSKDVIAESKERHKTNLQQFKEHGYYYSSNPYERKTTKPVWNITALFPLSKSFPEKYAELNNRKHPFQKYIDKQPSYKNALSTFRRKLIFIPMSFRFSKQEVDPINLEVMLDRFLANAILLWDEFQHNDFKKYVFSSDFEIALIEEKAKDLFNAIDTAHDKIKQSINIDAIQIIESLAHGYDGDVIEKEIPMDLRKSKQDWKQKRNRRLKEIHSYYSRFAPKINHKTSNKEIIMRILVSKYRDEFGLYELIGIPQGVKTNVDYDMDINVSRYNHDALKANNVAGKCWAEREEPVIHADVLVDLVALIDDAFMNEVQRTISRHASGQKNMDSDLHEIYSNPADSSRCHRSVKYVIPCHD